jgi:dolichol-phosphate mannosyltransferase
MKQSLSDVEAVVGGLDPGLAAAVTIATYNEAENLPALLEKLLAVQPPVGVVVVDDASPDGTGALADSLAAQHPGRIVVIHRPAKGGYASAVRRGLAWSYSAGFQRFVVMDADHSHDPAVLPQLLAGLQEAEMVIGSRYVAGGGVRHWPWFRRLLSRAGGALARLVTGLPVRDPTSGFRAFRRATLERIGVWATQAEGYAFLLETAFRAWAAGLRVLEVPIIFLDRTRGRSKLSRRIIWEALLLALRLGWVSRCPAARRRYVEQIRQCPSDCQA